MRHIRLLGTPEITDPDGLVPRFRSQLTVALLGYLVAERRTITRERLAVLFWPDDPLKKGKAKLRRELHNLGQILPGCWEIDRVQVCFAPTPETLIDIDELLNLEEGGEAQKAAVILRGEFLEGISLQNNLEFETWLMGEQERWRQHAERILTGAVEELESLGAYRRALRHARQLLNLIPWSEETHRLVMRLLALSGQRSAALKQFDLCKQLLSEELGVEPTAETLALYERIKQAPTYTNNFIPAVTSPIIGRDRELANIASMLLTPGTRLMTIVGLGGTGKTRLALAAAWQNTNGQFRDGVIFVPLAALDSQAQVVAAIARALHLPLTADDQREPRQKLLDYLKSKQLLLVLDNVEQLREGRDVIEAILQSAVAVRVLTTSRIPLRLPGEHQFPLHGLDFKMETADHTAAKLFAQAAQRMSPSFVISEYNSDLVNQLCRIVEGMPLALELAAGWIDKLPLTAIIEEIESNLDFLSGAEEDLPLRHRSMRAVFDGSWRQLRPQTQIAFASLSVFCGTFTREAAVYVADVSAVVLSELVSHSLLEFDLDTERYKVHELLRQYTAEKLSSIEITALKRRHLAYFAQTAVQMENDLKAGNMANFALWESDFNNIEAALDWSIEDVPSANDGLALAASLEDFWLGGKGHMQQGYVWVKAHSRPDLNSTARPQQARLWRTLGRMEGLMGPLEESTLSYFKRSLDIYKEIGDNSERARTMYYLGETLQDWNRQSEAENAYMEAFEIAAGTGDYQVQAAAKFGLSNLARIRRDLNKAQIFAQESLVIAREIDDRERIAHAQATMGMIAMEQQRWSAGRSLLQEALHLYLDIGYWGSLYVVFNSLGEIARANGTYDEAADYYRKGLHHARQQGIELDIMIALFNLGQAELMCGDVRQALTFIRQGWDLADPYPGEMKTLYLETYANIAASQGRPYDAALIWGAVEKLFENYGLHQDIADQLQHEYFLGIARSESDKLLFDRAWAEGRQMTLEQAAEIAVVSVATFATDEMQT